MESMYSFIDRNAEFIESINYGTSENTLSNSWFKLVEYISLYHPEIEQALTTNGYLAPALRTRNNSEILDTLDEVDVSLDFCDKDRHTHFRGHPKAYTWALETIKMCRHANKPTTIVILGTERTLEPENIRGIFKIAERYGCFVRINIYRPNRVNDTHILSLKSLYRTLNWVLSTQNVVALSDPLFSALFGTKRREDRSGKGSLRILPDGSVTPSTYLVSRKYCRAHIDDLNLADGNRTSRILLGNFADEYPVPTECETCHLVDSCRGGAFDRRLIWYGSLSHRDPYCPQLSKESLDSHLQITKKIESLGPSIHDGYLPTLIFKPSHYERMESRDEIFSATW